MRIAILGDLHLGIKSDSKLFHNYQQLFFENNFFPYLLKHDIKTVVILGDVFDRRKFSNHRTIQFCKNIIFDKLQEYDIRVHSLIGNHDIFMLQSNIINSPELLLKEYSNIDHYPSAEEIEIDDCKFLMVPWINNENIQETYELIEKSKAQILFGHLELSNEVLRRNFKFNEGISLKNLKKFEHVFSGHYHQKITKGNFKYLGTPYQLTWDDSDIDKGFHVFDTKSRDITFIKNPYKIYKKINWDDDGSYDLTSLLQEIDKHPDEYKNKYVKILVTKKNNPYILDRVIEAIEKHSPHNVSTEENLIYTTEDNESIDSIEDTLTTIQKYIESVDGLSNKVEVLTCMTELYTEAISIGNE